MVGALQYQTYCLEYWLLMCTFNPALKRVVKFKGALLTNRAFNFDCARGIRARIFHGRSCAISTPNTWLIQSANVATRYFSHRSFGCPLDGRHYQQNGLLCGATTSNFTFRMKSFQRLHAVTCACKRPMFVLVLGGTHLWLNTLTTCHNIN